MGDWAKDPAVIQAISEFDESRAAWLLIRPMYGDLNCFVSVDQVTAFIRMKIADHAYVWARDNAIHRVMLNYTQADAGLLWPEDIALSS